MALTCRGPSNYRLWCTGFQLKLRQAVTGDVITDSSNSNLEVKGLSFLNWTEKFVRAKVRGEHGDRPVDFQGLGGC